MIHYFLWLFVVFEIVKLTWSSCPLGYDNKFGNNKCYKVLDGMNNYLQAKKFCVNNYGGFLPIILTDDDNTAVVKVWFENRRSNTDLNNFPLIGLYCVGESSCKWDSGQPLKNFDKFLDYKPDISKGNCVSIQRQPNSDETYWRSTLCNESQLIICESDDVPICDEPYIFIENRCLLYSPQIKRSYAGAISYCEAKNGVLASVHTYEENQALLSLVQSSINIGYYEIIRAIYLGAKVDDTETFNWADSTRWDYSNFHSPFPSRRYGSCLKLITNSVEDTSNKLGEWHNVMCNTLLPFICEFQAPDRTPPGICPTDNYFMDTGRIQSSDFPDFYGYGLDCIYHINVDLNHFVKIVFEDFRLLDNDFIELFDGEDVDLPFKRLTNRSVINSTPFITKKSNLLRIRFHSGIRSEDRPNPNVYMFSKGWRLKFGPVGERNPVEGEKDNFSPSMDCPLDVYSANNGQISTMGFEDGLNYANLVNCVYKIFAGRDQIVQLQLLSFRTEKCCDFLHIFDGDSTEAPLITRMSGSDDEYQAKVVNSTGESLTVRFVSDSQVNYRGFIAKYRFIDVSKSIDI